MDDDDTINIAQSGAEKFIPATKVVSPKHHWHLFEILLDKGEGQCVYALGTWDGERVIGFRWNGVDGNPIGTPSSRGLPIWIILEQDLYDAVIQLAEQKLPASERPKIIPIARKFLGLD